MQETNPIQPLVDRTNNGDATFGTDQQASIPSANQISSGDADTPMAEGDMDQPMRGEHNKPIGGGEEDQPMGGKEKEPMVEEVKVDVENEDPLKILDGGWGWFVVLGSFLTHLLMGGFERSLGVLYLQLLEEFQMSATETSWVLAIFSTLRLCMGPVASMLCNKFSIRTVVYLGALLSTVGVLASAFTPNLSFLYFSFGVLAGCGRAMTYCPCLIIVGYYFNKRLGLAVGLATSGVGIGSFVFPPMIEKMYEHFGFRGTFLILAGLISNFFIGGALFRPLEKHRKILQNDRKRASRKKRSENSDGTNKLLGDTTTVPMATKDQNLLRTQNAVKMSSAMDIIADSKLMARRPSLFKRKFSQVKLALKGIDSSVKEDKKPLLELALFKNYAFTTLCIQLLLFTISMHTTFVFLPALAKSRGVTQIEGAYLLSILGICDAVARVVMSVVLDLKRVKQYRMILYNFLMVWVGVVSIAIPFMTSFWQFTIVSGLYGFLMGTYISQKTVVIVDVLGVEKLASSLGLILLFQGVGSLIGPIIGALFKDLLGSYDMSFYVGSTGIFLGAIVLATGNVWLHLQKKKTEDAKSNN